MDYANTPQSLMATLKRRGIRDHRVLAAIEAVPRHLFVPPQFERIAYADEALPIGCRQTISQPFIVAYMIEALQLKDGARVLEVGTGSGYQAAVLAHIAGRVYSIERHKALADSARAVIAKLGLENVVIVEGDGRAGLGEAAPFDGIVVSAAARTVPGALLDQLGEGGRMVLPLEEAGGQRLVLIEKRDGAFTRRDLIAVRFVPLIETPGDRIKVNKRD
jgi:protein-L-isoaspartate(D-aspartate) O-methyltransferase